jgi:hypothetical protein
MAKDLANMEKTLAEQVVIECNNMGGNSAVVRKIASNLREELKSRIVFDIKMKCSYTYEQTLLEMADFAINNLGVMKNLGG